MNEILKMFFSLSVSGSMIACILFVLKTVLKDKSSKAWQYYIWLIVIIRLLVPVSLETNIVGWIFSKADSIITTQNSHETAVSQNEISKTIHDIPAMDNFIQQPERRSPLIRAGDGMPQGKAIDYWDEIKNNLWLLWLGIATVLLVRKLTNYHSFVRYIKAGIDEVTDYEALAVYEAACQEAGLKKPLNIYSNRLASSPMLVGILRPFIVLPDTKLGEEELHNIFVHELTHYKRLDIFYKWLMQVTVCIHWYNPLVYLISREVNQYCELSCDEVIMKVLDDKGRRKYGDTLLASLKLNGSYGDAIVSITLNEDAKLLKERLEAIMKFKKNSKLTVILSILFTMAISCGALVTGAYAATSNQNPAMESRSIELIDSEFVKENGSLKLRLDFQNNTESNVTLFYFGFEGYNSSGEIVIASANNTNNLGKIIDPKQIESVYLINLPESLQALKLGIVKYDTNKGYSISIPDKQIVWNWLEVPMNNEHESDLSDVALVDYEFFSIGGNTPAIKPTFKNNTSYELNGIRAEIEFIGDGNILIYDAAISAKGGEIFTHSGWGLAAGVKQIKFGIISYTISDGRVYEVAEEHIKWHILTIYDRLINENQSAVKANNQNNASVAERYEENSAYPSNSLDHTANAFSEVDKAALELMWYSGSWEIVELLIPNMSEYGIDELVEMYNQKNQYTGTNAKKPSDYYDLSGDNVDDADARAIAMMRNNGMWKYTEPLFLYMSNKGIDEVVAIYNQKHPSGPLKIASDYYNTAPGAGGSEIIRYTREGKFSSNDYHIPAKSYTSEEADRRGIEIMENSGTWSQSIDLLIPNMTPAGVEKVVAIYLERHLFFGITTPEGAKQVASTIHTALKYMTDEARKNAENIIAAYL